MAVPPSAPASDPPEPTRPPAGPSDPLFRRVSWLVLAGVALFVFVPIAKALSRGVLFGYDWSEYALTARDWLTHQSNAFAYPSPVLPLLYVPLVAVTTDPVAIAVVAAVLSGLLIVLLYLAASRLFRIASGSGWAGLLGGLMLVTAPLFLDEVGWGGQSQFLAILLGVATLAILLERVLLRNRRSWAVVGALFLTIGVLSEPYAELYFVVATGVLLVLVFGCRVVTPGNLITGAAILLPPISAAATLAALNPSTTATVSSQGALAVLGNPAVYPALYVRLAFYNPALEILYPVLVVAYLLTGRVRRYPDPRFRWLVPALAVAEIPQFFVLTPWVDLDRAFYFLMVPFGAMVAELAVALPPLWRGALATVGHEEPPHPRTPIRRIRPYVVPTIALVAVLTVGAQMGVATHSYYGSLTYYSYPPGDLSELSFLRGENGSVLFVSPTSNFFPAAWATGRPLLPGPPAQPAAFTVPSQQSAVETANVLALGGSWISAGDVWAVDSEPAGASSAPGILELTNDYLLETLAVDDADQTITFTTSAAPNVVQVDALAQAPSIVHSVNTTSLVTQYAWPDLTVTKSVSLTPAGAIAVALDYTLSAATLATINASVEAPGFLPTSATVPAPNALGPVALAQTYSPGIVPIRYSDTIGVSTSGLVGNTTFLPASGGVPAHVLEELHPAPGSGGRFGVVLEVAPGARVALPGSVDTEGPTLAAYDVNWEVVERGSDSSFVERFLNDPAFSLDSVTPHYLVFRTDWGR